MVFHIWVVRDILGIVAIVDALSFYEVTLWSLIFDEFWFCFTLLLFWTWHPLVYHSWMIWDTLNTGYICVYPYLTSITLPSVSCCQLTSLTFMVISILNVCWNIRPQASICSQGVPCNTGVGMLRISFVLSVAPVLLWALNMVLAYDVFLKIGHCCLY